MGCAWFGDFAQIPKVGNRETERLCQRGFVGFPFLCVLNGSSGGYTFTGTSNSVFHVEFDKGLPMPVWGEDELDRPWGP